MTQNSENFNLLQLKQRKNSIKELTAKYGQKKFKELKQEVLQLFQAPNTKAFKSLIYRILSKLNVPKIYPLTKKWTIDLRCRISWEALLMAVERLGEKFNHILESLLDRCNSYLPKRLRPKKGDNLTKENPITPMMEETGENFKKVQGLTWIIPKLVGYITLNQECAIAFVGGKNKTKLGKIKTHFRKIEGIESIDILPNYISSCYVKGKWELTIITNKPEKLIEELNHYCKFGDFWESQIKTIPYTTFNIEVLGIELEVRYCPDFSGISHMEFFRFSEKSNHPKRSKFYYSHFITDPKAIEILGSPQEYAKAFCYALMENEAMAI